MERYDIEVGKRRELSPVRVLTNPGNQPLTNPGNLPISTSFKVPFPTENPLSRASPDEILKYSPDILCLYVEYGSTLQGLDRNLRWFGKWGNKELLKYPPFKEKSLIVKSQLVREIVIIIDNDRNLGYSVNNQDGPYQVVTILDFPSEHLGYDSIDVIDIFAGDPNNAVKILRSLRQLPLLGFTDEKVPGYTGAVKKISSRLDTRDLLDKVAPIKMIYWKLGYYLLTLRNARSSPIYESMKPLGIDVSGGNTVALQETIRPAIDIALGKYKDLMKAMKDTGLGVEENIYDNIHDATPLAGTPSMDKFDYTNLDAISEICTILDKASVYEKALLSEGGWRLLKLGNIQDVKNLYSIASDILTKCLYNACQQEMMDVLSTYLPKISKDPLIFTPAPINVDVSWFFSLRDIAEAYFYISQRPSSTISALKSKDRKRFIRDYLVDLNVKYVPEPRNVLSSEGPKKDPSLSVNDRLNKYLPLSMMNWENSYLTGKIIFDACTLNDTSFFYIESIEIEMKPDMLYKSAIGGADREGSDEVSAVKTFIIEPEGTLYILWNL